jgi:2TM domain
MPTQQTTSDRRADSRPLPRAEDEQQCRELAVKEIERKRHFQVRALTAAGVSVLLVIIWAISEYHNAGGWPTSGFNQSSGIPHEWNSWIIYPVVALGVGVAIDALHTYRRRPISECEIRREMNRLTGGRQQE